KHLFGNLFHLGIAFSRGKLLYDNNILFVYGRDEISCLSTKKSTNIVKCIRIFIVSSFNNKDNTSDVSVNMQFFGTVINIHQKKIIQQKIFDKIIFIKPLFICDKQILNLECRNLSDHIYVVISSVCKKDVLQLMFVKNLEELISLDHLAVGRRCYKRKYRILIIAVFRECR